MVGKSVPERVTWAVETLAVGPADHLLEIGCGRGTAVSLVCERLGSGRITAIDRSATMIRIARERNAGHVAAGTAVLRAVPLEAADLAGDRFDTIFAINVNLFWVREASKELDLVRGALRSGGALYLFYELPTRSRAKAIAERVVAFLTERGFTTTMSTATTKRQTALLCIRAQPGQQPAR